MATQLQGKKIVLGITGSIAAYKGAQLTRLLVKAGAEVRVLMTPAGADFISPLTLSTLSRNEVLSSVRTDTGWNNHVELGLWADAMVIAPLTATTMGKLALGIADNVIAAVYLSARCPVFFAPAMDVDMWRHPATQENVRRLRSFGNHLVPVGHGELASGLVGEGRMAEPEEIIEVLEAFFRQREDLAGQSVLITAGPTFEPLDPVRFIGNRSSGKMGLALAESAARRGAAVTLILGPSPLEVRHPAIKVIRVQTAREMHREALAAFPDCNAAILAAAVADYRPAVAADRKIKKKTDQMSIELVRNPDIAADLGGLKKEGQLLIGFALETHEEEANAREKLVRKNFDFIVLNTLRDAGAGFHFDTNKISILHRDNKIRHFELKSKTEVAADILDEMVSLMAPRSATPH